MLRACLYAALMLLAGCRTPAVLTREVVRRDTTVVIAGRRLDSLRVLRLRDTLRLAHERLTVQVLRHHDTFRIQAACAPETLWVPRVHEVIRLQPAPVPPTSPLPWMLLGAALLALGWMVLRRLL